MNENEHIIIFDYEETSKEYNNYYNSTEIYKLYHTSNNYYATTLNIIHSSFYPYWNNDINYTAYFDLSIILYKIHNPNYYRKYNCKELI